MGKILSKQINEMTAGTNKCFKVKKAKKKKRERERKKMVRET